MHRQLQLNYSKSMPDIPAQLATYSNHSLQIWHSSPVKWALFFTEKVLTQLPCENFLEKSQKIDEM